MTPKFVIKRLKIIESFVDSVICFLNNQKPRLKFEGKSNAWMFLTLPVLCISESCIEIKIN